MLKIPAVRSRNTYVLSAILGLIVCGLFIFIILRVTKWIHAQRVYETTYSEMKDLPEDVKRTLPQLAPSGNVRIPILMYHYVEHVKDTNDTFRMSMNTPPEIFEDQIKTLHDNGYTFLTAREVGYILDGERTLPAKPVSITIDDGHWDVYTDVLPILQKYGVKVTMYHISGFTGGSDFLSEDQIKKLIASGLVEIGAHTVHHIGLKGKPSQIVFAEVLLSKKMLELQYGITVDSFAYPNGEFDLTAIQAVQLAGFKTAVSTIPGVEESAANRFFLNRLRPGRRTGDALVQWMEGTSFKAFE